MRRINRRSVDLLDSPCRIYRRRCSSIHAIFHRAAYVLSYEQLRPFRANHLERSGKFFVHARYHLSIENKGLSASGTVKRRYRIQNFISTDLADLLRAYIGRHLVYAIWCRSTQLHYRCHWFDNQREPVFGILFSLALHRVPNLHTIRIEFRARRIDFIPRRRSLKDRIQSTSWKRRRKSMLNLIR